LIQVNTVQRRFWIGLLVALIVGIGIEQLLLLESRRSLLEEQARRLAIISVQSLAEIVQRAGAGEEVVAPAVIQFAKEHPYIKNVRVVHGLRLLGSTVPTDVADKAPPRRLSRDEKWIYDLGQRLRASVQTNQDEGVSRKAEIEITPSSSGGLVLSTPLEEEGSVVGYVQMETASSRRVTGGWLACLVAILVPLLLFTALCYFIGERKVLVAVVAFTLLVITMGAFGQYAFSFLRSDLQTQAKIASAIIQKENVIGTRILKELNIDTSVPLQGSKWDVDVFRKPRTPVSEHDLASGFHQALLLATGISALLLGLIGFGAISKLIQTVREYREAYAYTMPAMIGMVVLVFFPFLYGIVLSFTGSTLYNTDKSIPQIWVGLQNYKEILFDFGFIKKTAEGVFINYSNFYWTFLFTVIWTVTNVTIGVTLGLILALILNTKGLALKPIYRVLLIFPWAMPNYITALIWKGMFHQQFGVINQVIQLFGGEPISWFQKPLTSFITALATNGWLSFPFMMVVSLGALQSIPGDLYEAARVDGASRWQQFRSITLPSLKPALIPAIILSVVWTFNMFNIIYLVTAGEPAGSTEILITEAYKIAFEKYRYGYAAAYSTVIFMILLIYGSVQNRITRATEAIAG
jgi:arabinogalactan oligomer/maltooligosaccharide transport system permease protein